MPSQERLKELLEYRNKTLFWRETKGRRQTKKPAGNILANGYRCIRIDNYTTTVHRITWVWHNGSIPDGMVIDHINQNRSDNSIENLRLVTRQENHRNTKLYTNNTTGCHGIFRRPSGRWAVHFRIKGKNYYFGTYDRLGQAKQVRKSKEKEYGFSPLHGLMVG